MKELFNKDKYATVAGIIVLLIMAMVLSGCVEQNIQKTATNPEDLNTATTTPGPATAMTNPETATTSPKITVTTSPKTATATSSSAGKKVPAESLVQQSDVPDLIFSSFNYLSAVGNVEYSYSTKDHIRASIAREQIVPSYKEVGQTSTWTDNDGKSLTVQVHVFDTSAGNGKDLPDKLSYCKTDACGSANIGDASYYTTDPFLSDTEMTNLVFAKGEYFVSISCQGKTDKSLEEAMRIGKIIESRLKPQAAAVNLPKADIGSGVPPASIIKSADVPDLGFESFNYVIVMAKQEFSYATKEKISISTTNNDNGGSFKVVGHSSQWIDKDRQSVGVQVLEFETSDGNGEDLPDLLINCQQERVRCGSVNVGSASYYYTESWDDPKNPTTGQTTLYFSKGKYFVTIRASGRIGANYKEAERLAGIVADRLQ